MRPLYEIETYLFDREEVSMAFIFGSVAASSDRKDSDLDIGIYFRRKGGEVEWESERRFPEEDRIWLELERLAGKKVDLVVLNRAPASIVDTVLRKGRPLLIKDRMLYLDLLIRVSREAEDYREFIEGFWKLKHGRRAERTTH